MQVERIPYEDFISKSALKHDEPFQPFVPREKTVYVFALTRDMCSGCEIQKPLYEQLAKAMGEKYGERVKFSAIHVSQKDNFREELRDFRKLLRFAAYPTYLILFRTEIGVLETYRGIEPPMEEIARHIDLAMELANR